MLALKASILYLSLLFQWAYLEFVSFKIMFNLWTEFRFFAYILDILEYIFIKKIEALNYPIFVVKKKIRDGALIRCRERRLIR